MKIIKKNERVFFPMKLIIHTTPALDFAYCRTNGKHFVYHLFGMLVAPRECKHNTHARFVGK